MSRDMTTGLGTVLGIYAILIALGGFFVGLLVSWIF